MVNGTGRSRPEAAQNSSDPPQNVNFLKLFFLFFVNLSRGQTSDKISLNQLKATISHAVRKCQIIQFVREYHTVQLSIEGIILKNRGQIEGILKGKKKRAKSVFLCPVFKGS